MIRKDFDNNSYLVNNNALYRKHTEHISTTEPLYLDGMPGSDNIVHEDREKLRRAFEWIDTLLRILNKGLADLYGPAKLGTIKLNSTYSQCLIVFQGSDVNRWIPVLLGSYIILDLNGDSCLETIDADSLPEEYNDIALQAMQEDSLYVDGEIVDMPILDFSLVLSAMQILWDSEESLAELGINSEEDLLKLPILNIPVSDLSRHPEFILAERVPHGDTPRIDLKIPFDDNIYAAGYLEDKKFVLYGAENGYVLQIKNVNGEVSNTYPNASTMLQNYIIPKMQEKGYDVESSEIDTTSYSVGDFIPNWDSYINII